MCYYGQHSSGLNGFKKKLYSGTIIVSTTPQIPKKNFFSIYENISLFYAT